MFIIYSSLCNFCLRSFIKIPSTPNNYPQNYLKSRIHLGPKRNIFSCRTLKHVHTHKHLINVFLPTLIIKVFEFFELASITRFFEFRLRLHIFFASDPYVFTDNMFKLLNIIRRTHSSYLQIIYSPGMSN